MLQLVDPLDTCYQSQSSHDLKATLVYHLFSSKFVNNLQNKHHAVLKET